MPFSFSFLKVAKSTTVEPRYGQYENDVQQPLLEVFIGVRKGTRAHRTAANVNFQEEASKAFSHSPDISPTP